MTALSLPFDAKPYRRTAIFTETTIPAGLRNAHTTKEGSWAAIHVLEGTLIYKITDPRRPASSSRPSGTGSSRAARFSSSSNFTGASNRADPRKIDAPIFDLARRFR
jgi:hypothetical protein